MSPGSPQHLNKPQFLELSEGNYGCLKCYNTALNGIVQTGPHIIRAAHNNWQVVSAFISLASGWCLNGPSGNFVAKSMKTVI